MAPTPAEAATNTPLCVLGDGETGGTVPCAIPRSLLWSKRGRKINPLEGAAGAEAREVGRFYRGRVGAETRLTD